MHIVGVVVVVVAINRGSRDNASAAQQRVPMPREIAAFASHKTRRMAVLMPPSKPLASYTCRRGRHAYQRVLLGEENYSLGRRVETELVWKTPTPAKSMMLCTGALLSSVIPIYAKE